MNGEEQKTTAISTEVRTKKKRQSPALEGVRTWMRVRKEKGWELLFDITVGVVAYLFATCHAAFGVYPFSLALLFSASGRLVPILLGGAVGCAFLGAPGVLYLGLHIFAFFYRFAVSYPKERKRFPASPAFFGEEPALRAVGAVLVAAFMALYELILFGVENYTLLFGAGALLLLPLSTVLFSFFTAQKRSLRAVLGREAYSPSPYFGMHAPFLFSLGGVFLLFTCAFALKPYFLFGISLSGCAVTAFTLFVSRRYGAAKGCAAGLLIGLAGDALYLPVYGILGLLSGLYGGIGMPLSLAASVLAGGGYAAYVGGLSGFLSVMPEMTVTSLLLCVPLKLLPMEKVPLAASAAKKEAPPSEENTLACLSGALAAVSEEIRLSSSKERTPTPEEYEEICASAKESICRRCPAEGGCKESEAVKESLKTAVLRLSLGEGVPEIREAPCEGYEKMMEEIRQASALLGQKKRQGGMKGALSADYALLSEMLKEISLAHSESATRDGETERALAEALSGYGIAASEIRVFGGRRKQISLLGLEGVDGRAVEGEWVEDACVRVCGRSVSGISFSYEEGRLCARTESRRLFAVEGGVYTCAGKEGECAGDAAATLENEGGFVYALLSDGMGSGTRAASLSSLAVSVLTSLLAAEVGRQVALALLNNLICASEEECSVALDLLSLDLYEGRAGFLKSGAAASFVYRDGALFRIRSRTIPLGLLRIVDSEEASFEVRAGDVLLLVSDGVLGESEDGGWLKEILARRDGSEALARAVVERAAERNTSPDDKTALVLRILSAKEK